MGTSPGQCRDRGLHGCWRRPELRSCGEAVREVPGQRGLATAIPPRAHRFGGGSNNPTSQQNDMGTGMWSAVLTYSLITGCVCQNGPCHRSQHGNIIARGCTGGPCTRGAARSPPGERPGQREGLEIESSIVFPPVRVTKGQMDFHEMLLKNEKGLASGPRPRLPSQPQAKFYD